MEEHQPRYKKGQTAAFGQRAASVDSSLRSEEESSHRNERPPNIFTVKNNDDLYNKSKDNL